MEIYNQLYLLFEESFLQMPRLFIVIGGQETKLGFFLCKDRIF